jgi:hypothetical protein
MSNPIALFDDLRDMYLRYLDSPFDLRYPELVAERRALLSVDGRLFLRTGRVTRHSSKLRRLVLAVPGVTPKLPILPISCRLNFSRRAGPHTRIKIKCLRNLSSMETMSS